MNIPQRDYKPLKELAPTIKGFQKGGALIFNELFIPIFDLGYSQGFEHGWKIYKALKTDDNNPIEEEPRKPLQEVLKPIYDLGYSQGFEHGWKCYQAIETDGAGEDLTSSRDNQPGENRHQ